MKGSNSKDILKICIKIVLKKNKNNRNSCSQLEFKKIKIKNRWSHYIYYSKLKTGSRVHSSPDTKIPYKVLKFYYIYRIYQ